MTKMNLSDGPVFMLLQKKETLNQTNNFLKREFAYEAVWTNNIYCVAHCRFEYHFSEEKCDGEMGMMEKRNGMC